MTMAMAMATRTVIGLTVKGLNPGVISKVG